MKNIWLMRHAHAENGINDFERNISKIGIDESYRAKNFLSNCMIDLCLCSPSKRTKQTANIVMSNFNNSKIIFCNEIYNGNYKNIISIIEKLSDNISNLLIIGHNPHIHDIIITLSPTYNTKNLYINNTTIIILESKENSWSMSVKGNYSIIGKYDKYDCNN